MPPWDQRCWLWGFILLAGRATNTPRLDLDICTRVSPPQMQEWVSSSFLDLLPWRLGFPSLLFQDSLSISQGPESCFNLSLREMVVEEAWKGPGKRGCAVEGRAIVLETFMLTPYPQKGWLLSGITGRKPEHTGGLLALGYK